MSFKNFTNEMKGAYLIGMCAGKNVAESGSYCPDFQEMLTYIYEYKSSDIELTEELLMECLNEFGEVCNRYYMGRDKVIVNLSDIECYEEEDEIDYFIYKNDEWTIETCEVKDLFEEKKEEIKDGLICVSSLEDAKHIRRMFCLFHPELQHLREQTIKEIEEEEN